LQRIAQAPGESRFTEVDGLQLHYLEWPGPAGAKPVLLLHGFLAHAHWWDFISPWLAERYRVIAPDFSGMGDSAYRSQYQHSDFDQEIAAVIKAAGIEGCTAVGHSFGGRALLYACQRYPELIARAIVVDSRLGSPADPLRGFDEPWRPKKRYASQAEILSRFSLRPEEPAPAEALAYMARHSVRQDQGAWVWKFDDQLTRLFQSAPESARGLNDELALEGLRLPVDFIYGEQSRVVTAPRAARLAHCLPNVRSVTGLPASFHHLPVSQPIALLGTLRALLQLE
jgi:pimeloyl-ACP methyl ester carboxylesterase